MEKILLALSLFFLPSLVFAQPNIQGQAADGAAVAAFPLRIAGKDGAGNSQDIATDPSGELQVDILTGGGGTEFAEDSGHTSGQNGKMCLVVRQDADASLVGTDLDYAPIQVDATGRVKVAIIPANASSTEIQGAGADGVAAVGDPLQIGGVDGAGNTQRVLTDTGGAVQVDVESLPALVAGTANIGNTDVERFATAATVDTAVTGQTADVNLELATANLRLIGASFRESAATAAVATAILRHDVLAAGVCGGGAVIAFIELSANQAVTYDFTSRGYAVPNGVCLDILAGTFDGSLAFVTEAAP